MRPAYLRLLPAAYYMKKMQKFSIQKDGGKAATNWSVKPTMRKQIQKKKRMKTEIYQIILNLPLLAWI